MTVHFKDLFNKISGVYKINKLDLPFIYTVLSFESSTLVIIIIRSLAIYILTVLPTVSQNICVVLCLTRSVLYKYEEMMTYVVSFLI